MFISISSSLVVHAIEAAVLVLVVVVVVAVVVVVVVGVVVVVLVVVAVLVVAVVVVAVAACKYCLLDQIIIPLINSENFQINILSYS